jgi:hypothetical protein
LVHGDTVVVGEVWGDGLQGDAGNDIRDETIWQAVVTFWFLAKSAIWKACVTPCSAPMRHPRDFWWRNCVSLQANGGRYLADGAHLEECAVLRALPALRGGMG